MHIFSRSRYLNQTIADLEEHAARAFRVVLRLIRGCSHIADVLVEVIGTVLMIQYELAQTDTVTTEAMPVCPDVYAPLQCFIVSIALYFHLLDAFHDIFVL
jgi:hypothetical protein